MITSSAALVTGPNSDLGVKSTAQHARIKRERVLMKPFMTHLFVVALVVVGAALTGCARMIPSLMPSVDAEPNISADFPYAPHYVDVLGSRMHYVDAGDPDSPPIVLVHGNPTSSYLWRNVIPHLAANGRVIAVDLIGMGKSGKPDMPYRFEDHMRYFDAFIEALQLKDVVLVLHDWGGGVGLDYAMRHQDNVRAIALMEAFVVPINFSDLSLPERILFDGLRSPDGEELVMDENFFVEKLIPAMAGRELTEEEMSHYRAPYLKRADRKPIRMWVLELPFADEPERADNLKRVNTTYAKLKASELPLLLLTADPGALMKPETIEKLKADLPHLETQAIGAGLHYIQESQPTAIGKAVQAWIHELPRWQGAQKHATLEVR